MTAMNPPGSFIAPLVMASPVDSEVANVEAVSTPATEGVGVLDTGGVVFGDDDGVVVSVKTFPS